MSMKQKIRKMIGTCYKEMTLHFLYPLCYKIHAGKNYDSKKVVFLEIRMPSLTQDFELLYQNLEQRRDLKLSACYLREGMCSHLMVIKNSLNAIREIANAGYVFINDSSYLIGCLPLRKETQVIQTWHACGAFKKFGYSIADKKFGTGTEDLDRYPLHRNFSWVTVSSPEVAWAYAEAFHMGEADKILPVGISRTDCFFDRERIMQAEKRIRSVLKTHKIDTAGKKIMLYAPTFRGKVANAVSPDVLDFKQMHRELGTEWIFLCKHHPFVKHPPVIPEQCSGYALDVTKELEIEDLLMVSDVCVSDYSSLVFEYSLFERPMIFLAPDLEEYYDWRGFYYPYEEMAPGPIVKTTEELIACLHSLDTEIDYEKIRRFREKFMGACDGHATERIARLIK